MVTLFYFVVFIVSLIMTVSFLVRNKKVDTYFVLFSILVTINCLGRYMVAAAESLEWAIWGQKFLYVGGCYAPLLTVLVLSRLCNIRISPLIVFFLATFSTIIMGAVLTIGKSDFYYKHVELAQGNGYTYLVKEYGPMHALYPVMLVIYGIIMLFCLILALRKRKEISVQLVTTISVTGVSVTVMYILEKISGSNISFLSLGYLVGILYMIKYFDHINLYDMSVNLSTSMDKMSEYGYIAFDEKYRYVNANNYVKQTFPEVREWIVDRLVPVSESYFYQEVVDWMMRWNGEENLSKYISVNDGYYEMIIRYISHGKKENVGYLLEFVDRTLEKKYYNTIEEYNSVMEQEVEQRTEELRIQQQKMKKLFEQTVTALSEAVDAKDRYTSGHSKRVAKYARMIAERMGKSKEEQDEIYRAGLLHDVGKIRVPAEIINKPGRLTDEEFNIIKIHPVTGYHILNGISENSEIAVAAKYHHERYDGKGYPNGLAGENIPEIARILGVADAYDAMASNRSYRDALPQEVVRSEIEKGMGSQFDPHIAKIMLQMIDEDKEYAMKQTDSMQRKILSVDDEMMNNKIIAHIMKDEPMYQLVAASSGMEALDLLEQQSFDLILLDVKMPEMDGLETLKRIREKYRTPVVLMTGDKTLDISAGFAEFGCDDYITKPFLPLLVKEIVHNMTEQTEMGN